MICRFFRSEAVVLVTKMIMVIIIWTYSCEWLYTGAYEDLYMLLCAENSMEIALNVPRETSK